MAIRSNSRQARENIKKYILENANYYDYGISEGADFPEVAKMILGQFEITYCHPYNLQRCHNNKYNLFHDWASGLPSALDTCYFYNRSAVADLGMILEETEQEQAKYSEEQAEKQLSFLIYRELVKGVK